MSSLFKKVIQFRWLVLVLWLAVTVLAATLLPQLQTVVNRTDLSFLPKNAQTLKAEKWINNIQPTSKSKSSAVLVLSNKNGITAKDRAWFYAGVQKLLVHHNTYTISSILSTQTVPSLKSQLVSKDGTLEMAQVLFQHDVMTESTQQAIGDIRSVFAKDAPNGTHAYLTGAAAITVDFKKSSDDGLKKTEIITLVLVLGILLIVFRSPITPLFPLFVVALSFVITTGLVAYAADTFGLPISSFTQSFLIAVMFGAGTDYCILILQRYREELANGLARNEAIVKTMQTVGKTVLFAGSTVLIAFAIIGLAALNMYASAVGVAIGIAVTLIAAITLAPALMMITGRSLFWPIKIKVGDGHHDSKVWLNAAKLTNKRPLLVILVVLVLFMPLSTFFEGKRSFDDLAEISPKFDSVVGFRLIEHKFSAGEVLPVKVAIYDKHGSLRDLTAIAAQANITNAVSKLDFVSKVRSIAQPSGEAMPAMPVKQQMAMMQSPAYQQALSYYVSADGKYARMEIVLKENPYSQQALKQVPKIEDAIKKSVKGTVLKDASYRLAGTTAQYHELEGISQKDLVRTFTLVVIGIFLVLTIMLRSFVAPIYLLLSLVLNYFITMGILEFVFVKWLHYPGLSWTTSFFAFIIIVALGVDYSIFLMARIKEEFVPGGIRNAVEKAMASTGGVITSAALIMSGTFAAFMFSGVTTLMQIGAAIVIGLSCYTIIFMGFVVPATVRLLGDKNGWPFKF